MNGMITSHPHFPSRLKCKREQALNCSRQSEFTTFHHHWVKTFRWISCLAEYEPPATSSSLRLGQNQPYQCSTYTPGILGKEDRTNKIATRTTLMSSPVSSEVGKELIPTTSKTDSYLGQGCLSDYVRTCCITSISFWLALTIILPSM